MPLIFLIALLAALLIIVLTALILLNSLRTKGSIARALNMSLFLISMPRESAAEVNPQKPEKEFISVMEQLYASFSNLHAKGWNKFLYGEPYLALELAVHHVGEEIHFYIAVPKTYEQVFEKQAYGLFPKAEIIKVKDYNIFNPQGVQAGAYMKLASNSILPFKTYTKLESDPLGALTTALSKLEREGEGAAMQILIRPTHQDGVRKLAQKVAREMQSGQEFNKALKLAKRGPKPNKNQNQNEPPKVVTPFEEDVIKSLQAKSSRPLFDTNIRIVVSSYDKIRADQLLNDITGGFVQFSSPDLNSFNMSKISGRTLDKFIFNYAFRIFDNSQSVLLSSEELTSIYHFPLASSAMARVKFLGAKVAEPPPNLPQDGIILGENIFRGQRTTIHMTEEDRRRHLYVIGQTGTGKTNTMKAMVRQDIENGKGVCVLDPHGDFAEFALSVVPKHRIDDVIYFNPTDIERPLALNMLEIDPTKPEQKTFVANEMLAIVKSVYKDLPEAFGPMFEQYFKNAILLLLDDYENEIPTLVEIPRVLADENYRKDKLKRETNPLVKNFWEQEAEKAGGEAALANMVPYITSKLNPFLANDYVRPIVAQRKNAFNFRDVMDSQKILIVNVAKGKIGDINANLLGMIIVSKLLMAALSRDASKDNPDLYLYIDEFQNFTTESIATILSEARKYRLDLILAHQFIKQLRDDIRDAVFGNVGSMAVFRISPDDAEFMKNKFEPVFSPQDLIKINNNNTYMNLLVKGQTTRPFNMRIMTENVFGAGSQQIAEAVKEISRLRFGKPREDVESEILARYQVVVTP